MIILFHNFVSVENLKNQATSRLDSKVFNCNQTFAFEYVVKSFKKWNLKN